MYLAGENAPLSGVPRTLTEFKVDCGADLPHT